MVQLRDALIWIRLIRGLLTSRENVLSRTVVQWHCALCFYI